MPVFLAFLCFGLYFVNYRSWQAEILQERAEGCIQVDLQKKIHQDCIFILFCGFVGWYSAPSCDGLTFVVVKKLLTNGNFEHTICNKPAQ